MSNRDHSCRSTSSASVSSATPSIVWETDDVSKAARLDPDDGQHGSTSRLSTSGHPYACDDANNHLNGSRPHSPIIVDDSLSEPDREEQGEDRTRSEHRKSRPASVLRESRGDLRPLGSDSDLKKLQRGHLGEHSASNRMDGLDDEMDKQDWEARSGDERQSPQHIVYPPSSARETGRGNDEAPVVEAGEATSAVIPTDTLPPMDGGRRAWAFLAAATALETLVWGLPLSYGVFLAEYEQRWNDSPNARTILAQVGTVSTGAMYLLLPPVAWLLRQRPHLRQPSMYLGLVLVVASQLGAAFANTPGTLVATQGALYGLGGVALYAPATGLSFEWFRRKRGLASGIMYAGTGLGGLAGPFIVGGLISKLGTRWALVTIGIAYSVALAVVVPFVKPRIRVAESRSRWTIGRQRRRQQPRQESATITPPSASPGLDNDWSFLRGRAFWLLFAGVFFQALGGFVPGTYLPSYANEVALGTTTGTIALSLMNLARIPGQVALGHLADRGRPRRLILAMAIGSSTSVYLLWGLFAGSKPALLVFALCFGALAGSYTALFPRFIDIVQTAASNATGREPDPSLPQILYAFFSFSRGVGNIVAGPISTALLAMPGSAGDVGSYAVHGYSLVIVFTGATLALSGIGAGYAGLKTD